jgi:hypothetical protein
MHNKKYYSTVVAKNSALNPKTIKASSDGGIYKITVLTYFIKHFYDENYCIMHSCDM